MLKNILLALFVLSPTTHALNIPPACSDCSADAVSVANALAARGADCSFAAVSARRGFRCEARVTGYSQPVDVFIAPDFQKIRALALAYFFHGFLTDPKATPFDGANGDFGSFVADSKKNVLLIVPVSRGKDATYASELNTPAKMNSFLQNVEKLLSEAGVAVQANTSRLLAGHSGAYVQLGLMGDWAKAGSVPYFKSLIGYALLDAAYGYRSGQVNVMDAMCANPTAHYFMAFNPNDGSTGKRDTYARLLRELKSTHNCPHAQITYTPDSHTTHVVFPSKYLSGFIAEAIP